MKKSGRMLIVFVAFVILSLVVSSCTRKKPGVEQGIKMLKFMDCVTPDEIKRMDPLIKRFEESHPGVKIKVEYVPGGSMRQKILVGVAGGMAPDIVYLYDTAFPEFVEKDIFYPLDEFVENDRDFKISDFHQVAIKCATFKGKIYGIPPIYGTVVCFYNKTLFNKSGVPYPKDGWSWEEFREACRKLTIDQDKDGRPEQFGCGGIEFWEWTPMLFQNDGRILDENGKCVLNSKENLETLQFIKDMYTKDKAIVSQITFPGAFAGGGTAIDRGELFGTGNVGIQFSGMELIDKLPRDMDWDIVAPPERKGGKKYFHGGFFGYAITATSKNKEFAWEFMKFLLSKEVIKEMVDGAKEDKWRLMASPTRVSLQDSFFSMYPGKHIESYLYCMQYPEFSLAHAWGNPVVNEAFSNLGSIQENIMGITKGELKTVLDDITEFVNEKLGK